MHGKRQRTRVQTRTSSFAFQENKEKLQKATQAERRAAKTAWRAREKYALRGRTPNPLPSNALNLAFRYILPK
jgi:hypothetical protein